MNKRNQAAAFLNGYCDLPANYFSFIIEPENFVFFAADGGADTALKFGLKPRAVLGDMDSISPAAYQRLKEAGTDFIVFSADKDKTDTELLLEYLADQNFNIIILFAATGYRTDQTLINIQLLQKFPQAKIITAKEEIFCIDHGIKLSKKANCRISFIAMSEAVENFTLKGFKYEVEDILLKQASSLTISNIITSESAVITFSSGKVLLVIENP
ncbi:MAG: thiamine diphosphokinase [Candidatus Rifleibacteriota bacterium]